jgi:hypothetical protein
MKVAGGRERGKGEDMTRGKHILFVGLLLGAYFLASGVEGGTLGRAAARGAARSAGRALRGSPARTLRWERLRDGATRVRPLPKDRTVFRYTSKERAREELRGGLPPGSHMTSRGGAGRPLTPEHAQRRYGLPQKPEVRETVRLPKGQPTRSNRSIGGAPGVGETTSSKRVRPEAIKKVTPLRPGKD